MSSTKSVPIVLQLTRSKHRVQRLEFELAQAQRHITKLLRITEQQEKRMATYKTTQARLLGKLGERLDGTPVERAS